jgi:nitronate monooxygenase
MSMNHPKVIQGGMGVGVSNWRLARTVSVAGQIGVVSGTALDQVLIRRLQDGDPGGHMRRALEHLPVDGVAERILRTWFIPGGKSAHSPYRNLPMPSERLRRDSAELIIAANFAEVFLAREGHSGVIGINYLEKIQIPHMASIYGAMLAGVDYVLMGAGIPVRIPGVLDALARHEPATYPLQVSGGNDVVMEFSPRDFLQQPLPPLKRPNFLAIIASNTLAVMMLKKADGRVDGFIVEGPTAGGHNAPPRGKLQLNAAGEPVYGARDQVDVPALRSLGLPFWLAGGQGSPEGLREALGLGAAGIQAGTVFAFSAESGVSDALKHSALASLRSGTARVFTDPVASPTDFPFKVVNVDGTLAQPEVYATRPRTCDLGYLREAYRTPDGAVAFRCAAEPVTTYTAKGGNPANAEGRKCLCNALLANVGHPQIRAGAYEEPGLITAGSDLSQVARLTACYGQSYSAADVVGWLLQCEEASPLDVPCPSTGDHCSATAV